MAGRQQNGDHDWLEWGLRQCFGALSGYNSKHTAQEPSLPSPIFKADILNIPY